MEALLVTHEQKRGWTAVDAAKALLYEELRGNKQRAACLTGVTLCNVAACSIRRPAAYCVMFRLTSTSVKVKQYSPAAAGRSTSRGPIPAQCMVYIQLVGRIAYRMLHAEEMREVQCVIAQLRGARAALRTIRMMMPNDPLESYVAACDH